MGANRRGRNGFGHNAIHATSSPAHSAARRMNTWAALLLPPTAWGLGWLGLRWLRRELAPTRLEHPDAAAPLAGLQWVSVPTANGKHLAAQWLPGPAGRGVVILQHGWGGNGSQLRPAALEIGRASCRERV